MSTLVFGCVCFLGGTTAGAIFHAAIAKWYAKRGVNLPQR